MRSFNNHLVFLLVFLSLGSVLLAARTSVKDLPPRYRNWLTDEVNYIISNEERDAFLQLNNDQERDNFITRFWEVRNPVPGSPDNSYKDEIYRRIEYAKQYLGGIHTDMARTYITLGEPKQRAKYYGRQEVRPMEIWFYQNTNPALPPYFYVVFFDRDSNGSMRYYSPYMDGPGRLATSVLTVNDNKHALQAIDRALGREVARTTLSFLPDEPVDLQNATTSLASDVLVGTIKNLANNPLTKDQLDLKRAAESVTHRIVLGEEYLDVITTPLRDGQGNFNLHYVLRMRKPADFSIAQAEQKFFYHVQVGAKVYGPDNKLIFQQERDISHYLDPEQKARITGSLFGYEGWLALAPGKYRIDFTLANQVTKTAYRASRAVTIPNAPPSVRLSEVVAFANAESVGPSREFLPFTIGGIKFTPLTGDALTFAPGQNVNIFYQLWGPPAASTALKGKNLTVDYAYGRLGAGGDAKNIHETVAEDQFDAFGSMLTGKKIALPLEAGPGNYRLLVSVADPDNQQKVYSSLNFRVLGGSVAPPVYDIDDPELQDQVRSGVPEFDRALCSLAQNDKDSALRWFRASLARNPANEIARSRLAELYYSKQDYAEVAALFSRTPITPETDEQAILHGADSMARTGSLNHAISLLENAITLRKTSGPLYLALASYYRNEGNTQKATELESKGRELTRE